MLKEARIAYQLIIRSDEYKKIFQNLGFLSIIHLSNYFLPLLSLPYLASVLGANDFGQVMFAQAFVQYFSIVIDYGFNFSATKEISIHRTNPQVVSEIFCSVFTIKFFLFAVSLLTFTILVFTVERFFQYRFFYFLTFASVINNLIFPTWFFQGLEQMKYITYVNMVAKFSSTISIFIFIAKPSHFIFIPVINAASSIFPSLLSLIYLRKIFPLELKFPSIKRLIWDFKQGWYIFLSSVSSSLYSISNTFLLGLLFTNAYAGFYSFAEKIVRAGTSLYGPINNAFFPFFSLKMNQSPKEGVKIFKTLLLITIFVGTIGSLVIYFSGNLLVNLVKHEFYPSVEILRTLSPLILLVGVSNLIGFQILYTSGMEGKFLLSVFVAGIINLSLCFLLSSALQYNSGAVSLVVSETFITLSFIFYYRRFLFKSE